MTRITVTHLPTVTTVSPSPRDLVARLPDEEKIAIDLILLVGRGTDEAVDADKRFVALVPDDKRRGYLKTLAGQLRALGVSVHESVDLDRSIRDWEVQRAAERERLNASLQREADARARAAEEQRRADDALPPDARRAVQRRRRRQERRSRP